MTAQDTETNQQASSSPADMSAQDTETNQQACSSPADMTAQDTIQHRSVLTILHCHVPSRPLDISSVMIAGGITGDTVTAD